MTDDTAAILDDLLCRWHQWQESKLHTGRGFGTRSLVCGEYRVSRQYDLENGALDAAVDGTTMQAVDFAVTEMRDPWRAALYANARALVTGARVWSSPRLPQDRIEREAIVVSARAMLVRQLVNAGVM